MRILVLAKEPSLALEVVRALGAAGHAVEAAGSPRLSVVGVSRHCRRTVPVPPGFFDEDARAAVELLERHCAQAGIDVVVPADVEAVLLLARAGDAIRSARVFPVPTEELVLRCVDKWQFSELLRDIGLPHPFTQRVDDLQHPPPVDWSTPRFIKPSHGSFSIGAAPLRSRENLDDYAATLDARCDPPFVLQELVPGVDIDMSILAWEGRVLAATVQQLGPDAQTRIFVRHPEVESIGRRFVEACRYHGVVHLDMRIDARNGAVVVFEANPRFWTSFPWSVWMGVDFADLGVRAAMGESLGAPRAAREGACRRPLLRVADLLAGTLGRSRQGPGDRAAWRSVFGDPAPQLFQRVERTLRRQ